MFDIKKYELLFNEIYDALVINNHKNDKYIVDLNKNGKKTIKKLKKELKDEDIEYIENGSKLICFLDERSKQIAKSTYTPEVRQRLIDEQRELDEQFMKDYIYVLK